MKAKILLSLVAVNLCFSCSKELASPEPLISKPGYDHLGKISAKLSVAEQSDFSGLIQDAGRVEMAANILAAGDRSPISDEKIKKFLTQMTGVCTARTQDTSRTGEPGNFNIGTDVLGNSCPLSLKFIFSGFKQGATSEGFTLNSHFQIGDANLKLLNDVTKQDIVGSGSEVSSGNSNDSLKVINFNANGTIVSNSRGNVNVQRFIQAKIYLIRGAIDSAQFETTDEFQFQTHLVLLQQVISKNSKKSTIENYYMNGRAMNAQDYRKLMKAWGSHAEISIKL